MADLQRVDMGISLCHFELTVRDVGHEGEWVVAEPDVGRLPQLAEYVVSWKPVAS